MTRRPLQRARQWCARDPELLVTLVIAVGCPGRRPGPGAAPARLRPVRASAAAMYGLMYGRSFCVARGQGPLPVAQARALGGECGPGAEHLHVPSWDAAPDFSTTNRSTCD